jgi:sigma-B regulation protein RsbU (phosphoserine phosphatase)
MESALLKVLLIGRDERCALVLADLLRIRAGASELTTLPNLDAGLARLAAERFDLILFEVPAVGVAWLFQVTSLVSRAERVPVIVLGPANDQGFPAQVVRNGAQDYLVKDDLNLSMLNHAMHCAIERQEERIALIDERENYYSVFDHLIEGIFRTTTDGHYLLANVALARIYGYDSPLELMASIKDIAVRLYVEPGRREEFVRLMQMHDTLSGFESRIYRKDGTIIWIAENCRAVRDARGRLLYYEGTVEDISERKRSEEQIRRATSELSRSREELRGKNLVMEENLRTAREIQIAMLPQQYPCFPAGAPAADSAFQFVHRYQPAEAVSGDFFSITALSDTEAGVLICDVTGHGVRAALVTAMIRALGEELKPLARDPGLFLRKLNSDLCSILKSTGSPMLTTAFYLVANWETGVLHYANAGHPKPLLARRSEDRVEPLMNISGHSQPALGLFDDPPYRTSETVIAPGDFVMLFTDGLFEVQGPNEELYSQQRLLVDVKSLIHLPAGQLFDEVLERVRTFSVDQEFDDDVCLVGLEFARKPGAAIR